MVRSGGILRRRRASALLVAAAALVMAASWLWLAPARAAAGIVVAAEVRGDARETLLVLTLTEPVAVSSFVLAGPDRAVIDLPVAAGSVGEPKGRGLVAGLRFGLAGPGRSRLVLDLAAPAVVARSETVPGEVAGTWTLAVTLVRTDRPAFLRAAAPAADPVTTGSIGPGAAAPRRPVVVIDPGHGGSDPGARAAGGTQEKDLTLAVARIIRDKLVRAGRFEVVMTRDEDVFVPLDERVRIAQQAGAALFVSVHADSISRPSVAGATIYTCAERATDLESARLAERENRSLSAGGGTTNPAPEVADILRDLTVRETRGASQRFARTLLGELRGVMRFTVEPHREAAFRVLRAVDVPAVLLELGYLSNPRDTALMTSEAWQQRTTAAMTRAVEAFFGREAAGHAAVSP